MPEDDSGFTLIEILITLVIMGVAVSAILAGLGIATRSSGATRDVADASALLTATAEQIEGATYTTCPTSLATAYQSARAVAAASAPSGAGSTAVAATVVNLSLWDGDSFEPVTGAACTFDQSSAAPGAGNRMQRITLAHGDDRLTFIKRGPS